MQRVEKASLFDDPVDTALFILLMVSVPVCLACDLYELINEYKSATSLINFLLH
jgi:hypothetical protein